MPKYNTEINRIENNSIIEEYDTDYILYYDGSDYKGEIKEIENSDCIRDGYGVMTYADRITSYTGYYKDDLKHGKGKYTLMDGSSYEGEYRKGVRCGKGKCVTINEKGCLTYEGEWENDFKHGKGKYTYKEKYDDDVVNDIIINKNNIEFYEEEFEGTWVNDEKNGQGEMRIKGIWYNDTVMSNNEIEKRKNIEDYIESKINDSSSNNKCYDNTCKESYYNMFPPGEVYDFY